MIRLGFLIAKAGFELVLIFGTVYLGVAAALRWSTQFTNRDRVVIIMVIISVFVKIWIENSYLNP